MKTRLVTAGIAAAIAIGIMIASEFIPWIIIVALCVVGCMMEFEFLVLDFIYEYIKADTPKTLIYPKGTEIDLSTVKKIFNRFMIKDYVKSVKGTDFPVFFENSVSQEEFDSWMNKFYEYRGDLFTGGICVKEFVDLKRYGKSKNVKTTRCNDSA